MIASPASGRESATSGATNRKRASNDKSPAAGLCRGRKTLDMPTTSLGQNNTGKRWSEGRLRCSNTSGRFGNGTKASQGFRSIRVPRGFFADNHRARFGGEKGRPVKRLRCRASLRRDALAIIVVGSPGRVNEI